MINPLMSMYVNKSINPTSNPSTAPQHPKIHIRQPITRRKRSLLGQETANSPHRIGRKHTLDGIERGLGIGGSGVTFFAGSSSRFRGEKKMGRWSSKIGLLLLAAAAPLPLPFLPSTGRPRSFRRLG
jgi:hypothetical protein